MKPGIKDDKEAGRAGFKYDNFEGYKYVLILPMIPILIYRVKHLKPHG